MDEPQEASASPVPLPVVLVRLLTTGFVVVLAHIGFRPQVAFVTVLAIAGIGVVASEILRRALQPRPPQF